MKAERKFRIYFLTAVICIAMLIAGLFVQTATAEGFSVGSIAYVCADTRLNLRAEPQGEIIGDIARGKTVTILSKIDRNGYYFIRINQTGQECYAYGEYLALQENSSTAISSINASDSNSTITIDYSEVSKYAKGDILYVISEQKLNLRKKANRKADRIIYLYYGDTLEVLSSKVKNNYILVKDLSSNKIGYVDTSYVDFELEEKCYCESCECCCKEK